MAISVQNNKNNEPRHPKIHKRTHSFDKTGHIWVQTVNTGRARLTDWKEGRTSVPGVCNYGYLPLRHLGNIVIQ